MTHLVVHFMKDNTYTVHPDALEKMKVGHPYQFNFPTLQGKNKWLRGNVLYRGICLKPYKQLPFILY